MTVSPQQTRAQTDTALGRLTGAETAQIAARAKARHRLHTRAMGYCLLALFTFYVWLGFHESDQRARNQHLLGAISRNDLAAVRKLLREGADPNTRDFWTYWYIWRSYTRYGDSAMTLALNQNNPALVRLLLEAGANVRPDGITPLPLQTSTPLRPEIVGMLVSHGMDVNAHDQSGTTTLHFKAETGDATSVLWLLSRGAEIDAQDWKGATALMKAAWQGHINVVKVLLRHHANVHLKNKFGNTALSYIITTHAVQWGYYTAAQRNELIRLLSQAQTEER